MSSKTVCPSGWTQKGEECLKTVQRQETCYLDSSLGSPPCYGKGAAGGGGGGGIPEPSTIVPGKVPDLQTQCSDILQGYHSGIIQNIKELQTFERSLFNKLQALETSQVSPDNQNTIINHINTVSSTRTSLFNELQTMLQQEQCALSNDRYDLADQIALLSITEAELNRIKEQTQALKQARTNKLRMVEITNYEANRFEAHRNIFKNVAFCALGVVLSLYLVNKGWKNVGKAGVVLSVAIGIVLTIKAINDAWWRSPMNWNRYQSSSGRSGGGADANYETVWQHDVNAFWKGVHQTEDTAKSAYGAASSLASKVGGDLASDASSLSSRMESASKSAAGEQSHKCADEHGSCACTGTVKFGAGSKWSPPKRVSGSIQCSDTVFGDPDPGVRKTCVCGP